MMATVPVSPPQSPPVLTVTRHSSSDVLSRPHLSQLALTGQAATSQYLLSEFIRRQQTADKK